MNISFENKVALVTGAASGLGLATAKAFAESGASVVLADWNEKEVQAAAKSLAEKGHKTLAIRCDVSDDAQVEACSAAGDRSGFHATHDAVAELLPAGGEYLLWHGSSGARRRHRERRVRSQEARRTVFLWVGLLLGVLRDKQVAKMADALARSETLEDARVIATTVPAYSWRKRSSQ